MGAPLSQAGPSNHPQGLQCPPGHGKGKMVGTATFLQGLVYKVHARQPLPWPPGRRASAGGLGVAGQVPVVTPTREGGAVAQPKEESGMRSPEHWGMTCRGQGAIGTPGACVCLGQQRS